MATKPKVFVRDATGLVRELNWLDGTIMNLAYFNIACGSLLIFGLGSYLFPGSNMAISVGVIGFLVDLPIVIAYSMFAASMPRSGGDYIFISRALLPAIGFATSLVFFIFLSIFSIGFNAYLATALGVGPSLAAMASLPGNQGLLALAQSLGQPTNAMGIGLIFIVITFVLLLIPTSTLHKVMVVLFAIAFLGYPVLYIIVLATSSNAQFVSAFNTYAAQAGLNTSYTSIIESAKQAGANIIPPTLAGSVAALPIIYANLAFPQSSTYVAGETKRAKIQTPLSLVLGLLIICVSTAIMGYFTFSTFGYDFIAATAFYGLSGVSGYPLPSAPYTSYFIAILLPNPAFNWFMLLSLEAWILLLMITFGLMATRALFAWSFDRLVPTAFADVSERFHTPVKATILVIIASVPFVASTSYAFILTDINSVVAWTSGYLIVMISAILYPFLNKDLFEQSPPLVKKKIGGLPVISVIGSIGAIALLVIFYYLLINPSVSGATTIGISIVVLTYLVGIVIYYGVRAWRKSQGIELDLAFKQIPPE